MFTEADKSIRFPYSLDLRTIRVSKFLGQFIQVGESEFPGIGLVRYCQIDNIICNEVTVGSLEF